MRIHRWVSGSLLLGALLLSTAGVVQAQGFNAIYAKDLSDVWAVGNAGQVWRSLDGGLIWGSYPLGAANHRGVAAYGSRVIIVGDGGSCYLSDNGGFSFTQTILGSGANLRAVSWVDASTGWIAGDGGLVLKTTDAGLAFLPQTTGTTANLHAIRFANLNDGWACGENGTVLRTTNGGTNWTATTPFSVGRTLHDIEFSGNTVYVGGSYAFFASTTNGGSSWSEANLAIESRVDVDGIALLPTGRIVMTGGGGFVRLSTTGGATWQFSQHSVVTGLSDVHFSDASNGWACAARSNNFLRTTNAGLSWIGPNSASWSYTWSQKQNNPTGDNRGMTFDIDPVDRDILYGVQGLTVYRSTNRGNNWANAATITGGGSKTNSFYVSRSNNQVWVAAVQATDRVTKTTNSGATWTTTLLSQFTEYGMPLERDPNNPDVLYFGSEDGQFRKSTDFGSTWTVISDPNFRSPCDIVVVYGAPNVIWVGDGVTGSGSGQMFRSTDGGVSFTLEYTGQGSEIPTISATWLNPNIGFATHWSSGGVRRTFNQGDTWTQIATTGSAWGTDVAKDDPNVPAYGVYSGSLTYVSTDVGASFKTASLNGSNYAIMIYDRGDFFAMQSGGIYRANITQTGVSPNNAQLMTLTSPNGGEAWAYNEVRPITWTSQNVATVKIEFSVNGGAWQLITATASGPAGSYPWTVPNAPSTNVRVRVTDANDASPIDESNAPFSILVPSIATTEPSLNFGVVDVGDESTLTLHITNGGTAPLVISNVSASGSGIADAPVEGLSKAPVVFEPNRTSFTIAVGITDTVDVRFTPQDAVVYNETLTIESNAPGSPTLIPLTGEGQLAFRLVVPNGGESWQYNTEQLVAWQAGPASNVNIEYETSPGGGWLPIAMGIPATPASFSWTIPASASTNARVRITDAANGSVFDVSDAPFEIAVQALSVNPDDIDYGSVQAGYTVVQVINISNPGTAPLTVLNVASDNAAFSPQRTGFVVAAAASETLSVSFTPTDDIAYNATLTVTTDAPTVSETVALSGQGTAVTDVAGGLPHKFELRDAIPNPFADGGTTITYALPRETDVQLMVYNTSGQEVARLVDGRQPAGYHSVPFGDRVSASLTSGVYFYRLIAGEFVQTKQMVLVK